MVYNILLAAGITLLAFSMHTLKKSLRFLKSSERATATVVAIETLGSSDGNTYKPVFSFTTALRKEIIYRPEVSTSPAGWVVGDQAVIAYDADAPANARLLTYFGSFRWTIILLAIAMPLLVIGGGYFLTKSLLH
ncbi:MAG: DUF3592 domain-containing protein [Chitinophagaceae bacterium]